MANHFSKPGYVYIAESKNTGLFKIGLSSSPENRVKSLKGDVILFAKIKTRSMFEMEQYLHSNFKHHRYNGEWFKLCDTDLLQIIQITDSNVSKNKKLNYISNPPQRYDIYNIELSNGGNCNMKKCPLSNKIAIISPPGMPKNNLGMVTILGVRANKKISESDAIVVASGGKTYLISRVMLRVIHDTAKRQ